MLMAAMLMLTASLYATEKSEKKLSVKPFSVINVVGSLEVVYEQGSTYEVSLVGDAAAFDQIRAESNGSDRTSQSTARSLAMCMSKLPIRRTDAALLCT